MRNQLTDKILLCDIARMCQKGTTLDHDFYFVVGKQCRTKMRTQVTNTISLYKLINAILLLICINETLLIFKFIFIFQKIFLEC